jgi:hypothetical protein
MIKFKKKHYFCLKLYLRLCQNQKKEKFILSYGESYRNSISYTYDNHLEVVAQIDNCFVMFSLLAHRLKFQQEQVKNVYLLSYLTSIANNFLTVKQLFITGFHFQM